MDMLPEMARAGTAAIKIEVASVARLYVAQVTQVWRAAIDAVVKKNRETFKTQLPAAAALAKVGRQYEHARRGHRSAESAKLPLALLYYYHARTLAFYEQAAKWPLDIVHSRNRAFLRHLLRLPDHLELAENSAPPARKSCCPAGTLIESESDSEGASQIDHRWKI